MQSQIWSWTVVVKIYICCLGDCDSYEAAASDWLCTDGPVDLEIHKKYKGVFDYDINTEQMFVQHIDI